MGPDGAERVRRPKKKRLNPRHTLGTEKHGDGKVMVWECFSAQGVEPLYKIQELMKAEDYKSIMQNVMLPYSE